MDLPVADFMLRLAGAFYVFAGYAGLRAAVMGSFLDRALAAISAKPVPRAERQRQYWLTFAPLGIGLGGLALLLLWQGAVALFVLNALVQAVYLGIVAPRFLDPEDPPDAQGRRSTWIAFLLYLGVTAAVVLADQRGSLLVLEAIDPILLAGSVVAFILAYGLVLRQLVDRPGRGAADEPTEDFMPRPPPARLRLTPTWGGTGLIETETGFPWETWEQADHLPEELTARLVAWAGLFQSLADPHDPHRFTLLAPASQDRITEAGEALLPDLRAALPDSTIDFEPVAQPVPAAIEVSGGVVLTPGVHNWSLRSLPEDGDELVSPQEFGLSWQLQLDLEAWGSEYNTDYELDPPPWTGERLAAYFSHAEALAARLRQELAATGRGHLKVEISDPMAPP